MTYKHTCKVGFYKHCIALFIFHKTAQYYEILMRLIRPTVILFLTFVLISIPIVCGKGIVYAGQPLTLEILSKCEPFKIQTPVIERSEAEIKEEEEKKNAYLNKLCIDCHKDVYTSLEGYAYQHFNIVPKNCALCHLKLTREAEVMSVKEHYEQIIGQKYDKEFLVPIGTHTDDIGICFNAKLTNKNGKIVESDFLRVIPSKVKAELTKDLSPPVITVIKITDFILGVFDDVQISWNTDEFSDSEVQYGYSEDYDEKVRDLNLVKNHNILLKTLRHGTKVNYRVVSMDNFGNIAKSGNNTFSTSDDQIYIKKDMASLSPPTVEKVGALKIGTDIFLYIKTDQNVLYRIDYKPEDSAVVGKEESSEASAVNEASQSNSSDDTVLAHSKGLKTKKDVGLKSCRRCHKDQEAGEHPTNVRPPKKPANDLPLIEGVMTCVTCHGAHGGDKPAILRLIDRDLCNSCHTIGG
jgi:predicted CXXCH cytochrome family protein